jgi:hypothetical protein
VRERDQGNNEGGMPVKFGAENKKQLIIASVLGAVALIQVVRMMWPSGSSQPPVAASPAVSSPLPTSSSAASHPGGVRAAKLVSSGEPSLDPTLRLQLLHAVESINYGGSGRNIFVEQPDAPPIPVPVASVAKDLPPPGPPPPPPPPPITLKFFGFANKTGEAKRIFLSEGEDVFIAAEGDIVNRRYKVVHINPTSVEIEDVLYNHSQSIPLTQS